MDSKSKTLLDAACSWVGQSCPDAKSANDILNRMGYERGSVSKIWFALMSSLFHTVPWLILDGEDIHKKDKKGKTVLHELAGKEGLLTCDLFELFIELGVDPSAIDNDGVSVLQSLCYERIKKVGMFSLLLEKGADPNCIMGNQNKSLLSFCVSKPELYDFAHCLLSAGADPNPVDDKGLTPLSHFLIPLSASLEVFLGSSSGGFLVKKSDTIETLKAKESLFKRLLNCGADIDIGSYLDKNALYLLKESVGSDFDHLRVIFDQFHMNQELPKANPASVKPQSTHRL